MMGVLNTSPHPSNVNAESALQAVLRGIAEVKHLQHHGMDYLLARVDTSPFKSDQIQDDG